MRAKKIGKFRKGVKVESESQNHSAQCPPTGLRTGDGLRTDSVIGRTRMGSAQRRAGRQQA